MIARRFLLIGVSAVVRLVLSLSFLLLLQNASAAESPLLSRRKIDNHFRFGMTMEQVSAISDAYRSSSGAIVTREWNNARIGVARVYYSGQKPQEVTLRFFFIGRDTAEKRLMIYHYQAVPLTVRPSAEAAFATLSPVITSKKTTSRIADYGRAFDSINGILPFGWVATLDQKGVVVAEAASTPEMITGLRRLIDETGADRLLVLNREAEDRDKRSNVRMP